MNPSLTLATLIGGVTLVACASAPQPPPELVEARRAVELAERNPAVTTHAPLELKRATDTLVRANDLLEEGRNPTEVGSLAHVAAQQAHTAEAIAQAKGSDAAIAGAQVERERIRADLRTAETRSANAKADAANTKADAAGGRAVAAQSQASAALRQTAVAEQRADAAQQQTDLAQAERAQALAQSSQLQDQLSALQARQTERGLLVTLGDVLFEFNRAEVRPQAQSSLRKLADFLQQYPDRKVLVEGHTDSIGSAQSNEALSLRRAEAVDAALVKLGVAEQRVATAGYGKDYPVEPNATESGRALNRRVEVYIGEGDQPVKTRR